MRSLDHRNDLVGGDIEHARAVSSIDLPMKPAERGNRAARRLRDRRWREPRLGAAQHVGRAGVGDGITAAIGRAHRDVIGGIVGLRLDHSILGSTMSSVGEGGVGKAAMWALRGPTSTSLPLPSAHHAAAGDAERRARPAN